MTTNKAFLAIAVLAGLVVGTYSGILLAKPSQPSPADVLNELKAGATNYNRPISFDEGVQVDNTTVIDGSGVFTGSINSAGTLILGSSGTSTSAFVCGTATWNPPSVASSGNTLATAATTTRLAFSTTFTANRPIGIRLSSATSTGVDFGTYNDAGATTSTLTVSLLNLSAAAIDFATGTATACQWQ